MYLNLINAIDSDPVYEINAQRFSNEFPRLGRAGERFKGARSSSRMLNLDR